MLLHPVQDDNNYDPIGALSSSVLFEGTPWDDPPGRCALEANYVSSTNRRYLGA